jgi:hypothetical protein
MGRRPLPRGCRPRRRCRGRGNHASFLRRTGSVFLFRSLQDRLLATLAQKDAEDVRNAAQLQTETLGRALEKLRTATGGGVSIQDQKLSAPAELQEAEQLLSEAWGIGRTLRR